jgi:prepilin-type N-terminal cleavage/methylation domain-containing protein
MKTRAYKTGFTLVEIVVVIAIIALLVSMVIRIAKRIGDHAKERLCRENIALIGNALEQFRDFGHEYLFDEGTVFPLDCNGYPLTSVSPDPNLPGTLRYSSFFGLYDAPIITISGAHDPNFSGSEALYFLLSQVPDCRKTLEKIDKSLLTDKGTDGNPITITIGTLPAKPLIRIIDPWGTTLRYDYYPDYYDYLIAFPTKHWATYYPYRDSAKKTFPVITSAGPDKQFDTDDDITNVK